MGKAVRSDRIRIEVWKCLGDVGVWLLTNLFNNILSIDKSLLQQLETKLINFKKVLGNNTHLVEHLKHMFSIFK